jgi:hypothetical protein
VAAGTFVAGIVLAWYLFRPGVLASVGTAQLVLLVGLFTLPLIAMAAWEFERRARRSAPVMRGVENEAHDPDLELDLGAEHERLAAEFHSDRRDDSQTEPSAAGSIDDLPVLEPRAEVARELLENPGCQPARELGPDAMSDEAPDSGTTDVPRHRHAAHARRRAAEGVG